MNNLCDDCQINEGHKILSFMEALVRHFEKNGPISVNIHPRRGKSVAGRYFHQQCKEAGGVYVMLDGMIDYSTTPPMFIPNKPEIVGRDNGKFSGAIILDDNRILRQRKNKAAHH